MERAWKAEMQELRESLAKPKTFAEVASLNTRPTAAETTSKSLSRPVPRDQNQSMKVEQAKREFTLTTDEVDNETKEQFENMTSKDIIRKLQQVINDANLEGTTPKLQAANKLQNGSIKVYCRSAEEMKTLKNMDWDASIKGLKTKIPKYSIVVHGVPTEVIDFNADKQTIMTEIQEDNNFNNSSIVDITPLRRKTNFVNTSRY
jgi:hypothetical protein